MCVCVYIITYINLSLSVHVILYLQQPPRSRLAAQGRFGGITELGISTVRLAARCARATTSFIFSWPGDWFSSRPEKVSIRARLSGPDIRIQDLRLKASVMLGFLALRVGG